jgi:hypothetical protein
MMKKKQVIKKRGGGMMKKMGMGGDAMIHLEKQWLQE